jgi:hypothetical protein
MSLQEVGQHCRKNESSICKQYSALCILSSHNFSSVVVFLEQIPKVYCSSVILLYSWVTVEAIIYYIFLKARRKDFESFYRKEMIGV